MMQSRALTIAGMVFFGMIMMALAQDVSGEWVVEEDQSKGNPPRTIFEFEAHGSELTGSMLGYPDTETPILSGKISGDKITFTMKEYFGERSVSYVYTGKISGDTIRFDVVTMVGHGIPPHRKIIARRVSPKP